MNPNIGYKRLVNLMIAWQHDITKMMGGMGINSIESLEATPLCCGELGRTEKELEILGIKYAGE